MRRFTIQISYQILSGCRKSAIFGPCDRSVNWEEISACRFLAAGIPSIFRESRNDLPVFRHKKTSGDGISTNKRGSPQNNPETRPTKSYRRVAIGVTIRIQIEQRKIRSVRRYLFYFVCFSGHILFPRVTQEIRCTIEFILENF